MAIADSLSAERRPVLIAIDRSAAPHIPEITYVLRTLLRTAAFPWTFIWSDSTEGPVDIAYGDGAWERAAIRIPRTQWSFPTVTDLEPTDVLRFESISLLRFPGEDLQARAGAPLTFPVDVLFGAFWWLTGARESTYRRDRRDNLRLDDRLIRRARLLERPMVSRLAALLRRHLEKLGLRPRAPSWENAGRRLTFVLTHDVDYPQIIRWIEVPRLLATRGRQGPRLALEVAAGRSHFWTFGEWVDFADSLGTKPAFYFMARQGSLLEYALGTPDDFYDVRSPRFTRLLKELGDRGCEIGLHASYNAFESSEVLRKERECIEQVSGAAGIGNRHHYWHLDPANPNETLRRHEDAGLLYDSSLGLEFHPGFRRGICHPFRPFHAGERRELDIVQLPPTWMDDHFGRRLRNNGITDPEATALSLVSEARETGGTIVVDYHSRGANAQIYPEYGPWLMNFVRTNLGSDVAFLTPRSVVQAYREHSDMIDRYSEDRLSSGAIVAGVDDMVEIDRLRETDITGTATLHQLLFGDPAVNGHSVGTLGMDVLAGVFYRLNVDNGAFFCDVARANGRIVGFSIYTTDRSRVFRHMIRVHPALLAWRSLKALMKRPALLRPFTANLLYLLGEDQPFLAGVRGWWIVAGVDPAWRTDEIERRVGGPISVRLFRRMEERLRAAGCDAWYGVVRPSNVPINRFLTREGAEAVGTATAQGLEMRYYIKRFHSAAGSRKQHA